VSKFWDTPRNTSTPAVDAVGRTPRTFPASFTIGNVRIAPPPSLHPWPESPTPSSAGFIKNLGGCGLIMTEFTSADGVLRDQRVRGRYLHFYEDEHPISAQLFRQQSRKCWPMPRAWWKTCGFDLVDLNLGCPAKKL